MSFFLVNNHSATVAKMVILIVDHAVLAGSDALYLLVRLNAVEVADTTDIAMRELRRVTDLEGNLFRVVELAPRILGDEIEAVHIDGLAILCLGIIAVRDVDIVTANVLLNHKPRATTQAQSGPIPYAVRWYETNSRCAYPAPCRSPVPRSYPDAYPSNAR